MTIHVVARVIARAHLHAGPYALAYVVYADTKEYQKYDATNPNNSPHPTAHASDKNLGAMFVLNSD